MIEHIFEIEDLRQLRQYIASQTDIDGVRRRLIDEFSKYAVYSDATEWNRAVRLCEALAITGWGDCEPVEAIRDIYVNGAPNTFFMNRDGRSRFLSAVWSKRKDGFAIDYSRSRYYESPDASFLNVGNPVFRNDLSESQDCRLLTQRNWIPKNPILIIRGLANCYKNTLPVVESIEKELMPALDRGMRPQLYGSELNMITFNCSFSFYDDDNCKCNYVIADESLKLTQKDFYPALLEMFTEEEIDRWGYYLRNRFAFGPFRSDTGKTRVVIVFEKEFSNLSHSEQKQLIGAYLLHAVKKVADRLKKKIDYDFGLMISDFKSIVDEWSGEEA